MERSKAALRGFGKNMSPILIGWENDLPANYPPTGPKNPYIPMNGAEQAGPTL